MRSNDKRTRAKRTRRQEQHFLCARSTDRFDAHAHDQRIVSLSLSIQSNHYFIPIDTLSHLIIIRIVSEE